jgi:aminomethyltransferase
MVGFAGYHMPVQYPAGILREHLHTRSHAGLFDVSHMGQIRLRGAGAAAALEQLVPADVVGLAPGRQRYSFFTNDAGGIQDDLMIANAGEHLVLVVNASRKAEDLTLLQSGLGSRCSVEPLEERALLALQGPAAAQVLQRLCPALASMAFMSVTEAQVAGVPAFVSRSGYTGEDGFELSITAADAEALARHLLRQPEVALVGLGARDSLRLEAGLCLYGHDLDDSTTPVEAGLEWTIGQARRPEGGRAGGFPGATRIFDELARGPARRRVGLRPEGRAPVREGVDLMDEAGTPVGRTTSGGFGPSVDGPTAMAYVDDRHANAGQQLRVDVRGKRRICAVAALPFVPHRYFQRGRGA